MFDPLLCVFDRDVFGVTYVGQCNLHVCEQTGDGYDQHQHDVADDLKDFFHMLWGLGI
jgi:hypothetical protein